MTGVIEYSVPSGVEFDFQTLCVVAFKAEISDYGEEDISPGCARKGFLTGPR